PFYTHWNEDLFQAYLEAFHLPYRKKIKTFSQGMKMKCSLLFALAHEPEFLIMDEPAAGLDPVFRRELLDLLQEKMLNENQTLFLSTHQTADLDRIADYIVFINEGHIVLQKSMDEIHERFHVVKGKPNMIDADTKELFVGVHVTDTGFTGLFAGDPAIFDVYGTEIIIQKATLEDLMYFVTKQEREASQNDRTDSAGPFVEEMGRAGDRCDFAALGLYQYQSADHDASYARHHSYGVQSFLCR